MIMGSALPGRQRMYYIEVSETVLAKHLDHVIHLPLSPAAGQKKLVPSAIGGWEDGQEDQRRNKQNSCCLAK